MRDTTDAAKADIGVVVALPMEGATLLELGERRRSYVGDKFRFTGMKLDGRRIVVVESGTGHRLATAATHALLDAHHPEWVFSLGFSGALKPQLKLHDLVIATEIEDTSQGHAHIDVKFGEDPARGIYTGKVFTADHIVRTVEEKRALGERTGALAVDLESYAVVNACRERKTRCLVVRVISDDMTRDLPVEALSLLGQTGSVRWGATLASIWNRPGCVSELWELRSVALAAAERLGKFSASLFPDLPLRTIES